MSLSAEDVLEHQRALQVCETEYFRLLGDECRRIIIEMVATQSGTYELDDLAATVLSRCSHRPAGQTDPDALLIELHHTHLPILDSAGVITYDPRERIVTFR